MMSAAVASLRRHVLLVPAAVVLGGLCLAPLIWFFVVSFFQVSLFQLVPAFSLTNYERILSGYVVPITYTAGISATIAATTTLLALIVAHLIWSRGDRWGNFLLGAALLSLFGGYLVKIYAWRTLLGREGIVNNTLMSLHVTDVPIDALLYSPVAVVLVLVSYLLPFAILPIYGGLRAIDTAGLEAARDLGASPWGAMRDAVLPRIVPSMMTAFSLSFLVSAGDYVTPRLVGGTRTMMMGNFIESQFGLRMNMPLGAAMTFSTLLTSLAVITVAWISLRTLMRAR